MTTESAPMPSRKWRSTASGWIWVACPILFLIFGPASSAGANTSEIEINKSQRQLIVRNGGEIHKVYRMASGRGGPGDKQRLGDNKTPIGTYYVIGFNEKSKFDYFIHLNYPNFEDASHGLKEQVITSLEFKKIVGALRRDEPPPQGTALGGAIGIHGIGLETPEKLHIHSNLNWTEGCIALRNNEIRELRHTVTIGTKVIITE